MNLFPYIKYDQKIMGDSNNIINYINHEYDINFNKNLTLGETSVSFALTRRLNFHLYFAMCYSRWQDEAFYPEFRDEFIKNLPNFTEEDLYHTQQKNIEKYMMLKAYVNPALMILRSLFN